MLYTVLVFSVYAWSGNELKPAKAYAVIAYFNILLVPSRQHGMLIGRYFAAK